MRFSSGQKMQLDVFLPSESLAFEYQGRQHYFDAYSLGPHWAYQRRDMEKKTSCEENGITIIEVPYWWDGNKESLLPTIHKYRPDLISDPGNGNPIPTEYDDHFAGESIHPILW
jgi:hypothetical protein